MGTGRPTDAARTDRALTMPGGGRRRRVVGVIGSGAQADERAPQVGRLVAALGYDLLTGGGRGVMEAASRAFAEFPGRRGLVIGILPGMVSDLEALETHRTTGPVGCDAPPGYPNPWVELVIRTHLPESGEAGTRRSSRNHINVLSSDAVVALPGAAGTRSEAWLAARYGVPSVAYGAQPGLPEGIEVVDDLDAVRRFLIVTLDAPPQGSRET